MSERYCEKINKIIYDGYSSEIISQLYKSLDKPEKSSKEEYMVYKILEGYYSLLCEYEMLEKRMSSYLAIYSKYRNLRKEIADKEYVPSTMYNVMSRIIKVHKALEELESSQFIQALIKETSNGLKIRMDFLTPEEDAFLTPEDDAYFYEGVLSLYEKSVPFNEFESTKGKSFNKIFAIIISYAIFFGIPLLIAYIISLQ